MRTAFLPVTVVLFGTSLGLAQIRPLGNATLRRSEPISRCVTYTKDSGEVYCVVCTSGLNWTESVKERGSPVVISGVVGKAGVGTSPDEAKANMTGVKTKQDASGKLRVYFEQEKAVKGVKVFSLDLERGGELTFESLEDVQFIPRKTKK